MHAAPTPRGQPARMKSVRLSWAMHFDAHQPIIDDLEARILTIRDSL